MIDDSILRQFPDDSLVRPLNEEAIIRMLNGVFVDDSEWDQGQKETNPVLDIVLKNYQAGTIDAEALATFALSELADRQGMERDD